MRQVHGHHLRGSADRTGVTQRRQQQGKRLQVEVRGAVVDHVAEGLLHEQQVERSRGREGGHGGRGKGAGVGGVQHSRAVGRRDLPQDGLGRLACRV